MSAAPGAAPIHNYVSCKVCDRGTLCPKKIYRMSGPVVFIGHVLLIPTFLGLAFSIFMAVPASPTEHGALIFAILLATSSLVIGLLGWLLIMKKHVLKCDICGATINAS